MSDIFVIKGGKSLRGELSVKGAKNHILKMIPASLLCDGPVKLTNVPNISDVRLMLEILADLGSQVNFGDTVIDINNSSVNKAQLAEDLVIKMRASFLFIVPLLHKFGNVEFPHPGGDQIGKRPIDMTLDFLINMGATLEQKPDAYVISADKLKGIDYTFKWVSHTGTEALIMAAVKADGRTVIKNAAMEPEVVEMCEFLNSVGARISGQGTTTIVIEGVNQLSGGQSAIIPDRLDAGTFAILGALCGDSLKISDMNPEHLDALWKYFDLMGVNYELSENSVTVYKSENLTCQHIKTHEYPGFITDLQPPMTLLLTQAKGLSLMHETIYDGRLFYTYQLNQMGANIIMADPHRVLIQGSTQLYGKRIASPDIRAGMTMVMAALIARGESRIAEIFHIDRGYENLEIRLRSVGADIERKNQE